MAQPRYKRGDRLKTWWGEHVVVVEDESGYFTTKVASELNGMVFWITNRQCRRITDKEKSE